MRQHLLGYPNSRIIVLGPSNTSVDNLGERLAATGIRIVRLGHFARISPSVIDSSLENLIHDSDSDKVTQEIKRDINDLLLSMWKTKSSSKRKEIYKEIRWLKSDLKAREEKLTQEIISTSQVILCTCHG